MELKHYDIVTPATKPPSNNGWLRLWHGCWRMKRVWSPDKAATLDDSVIYAVAGDGELGELEFEIDCFLSILADIKRSEVTLIELGAGWGEWCLALAGVINNKLMLSQVRDYHCVAVEAEPLHYMWTCEHFRAQGVKGVAVYGAVSDNNGKCWFNINMPPSAYYGQSMSFIHPLDRRVCLGLYNLLTKKAVRVPTYTVDSIIGEQNLEYVDIVQMDVQGAECKVLEGCRQSIGAGVIDYFMISTHKAGHNDKISAMLSDRYDLLVNCLPFTANRVDGFPVVRCQDGIMVFRRKGGRDEKGK